MNDELDVSDLNPCPGCGGQAILVENLVRGTWEVRCRSCPTFIWAEDADQAMVKWQDGTKKEKHPKVYAFVDAPVEIRWLERKGTLLRTDMVRFNETGEAS